MLADEKRSMSASFKDKVCMGTVQHEYELELSKTKLKLIGIIENV